ncbi:MAG: glycosyltransferase, partial [Muribaculaceae bacterium]|nr:glycosyltransferase [Muribaculaceae bacterium]
MKILYVVSGTGLQGGATKSFFAMADGVAREGNEIKVVAPDANGVTVAARERGWEVLVVPYRFCALPSWHTMRDKLMFLPRLLKTVICNLKARKVVRKFAEHYRPDIIHDNTSVTDIGHYAATHIGATHVIHVREYGWKDFRLVLPFINERLHYPKAALIAITDDLRELRGKGMPADRCTTIYNGVVKKEQIRYNPDKEPYFLYAGRIQEAKGVRDLIDAYISYARKIQSESKNPMRMVMAGSVTHDPGLYADLRRKLLDAGLDGNVEWMGEIKNVDKYM